MKSEMQTILEGHNNIKYVTKVEVNKRHPSAIVFTDPPSESYKKPKPVQMGYTKFIFLRNFDLMEDHNRMEFKKYLEEYKELIDGDRQEYYDNLKRLDEIKELKKEEISKNRSKYYRFKRKLDPWVGLNPDEALIQVNRNVPELKEESGKDTFEEIYEYVEKIIDDLQYKSDAYDVESTKKKQWNEAYENRIGRYIGNGHIDIDRILSYYMIEKGDPLRVFLNSRVKSPMNPDVEKGILPKYEDRIEVAKKLPSLKNINNFLDLFNQEKKLSKGRKLKLRRLTILNDENGKPFDRLKYGYVFCIQTKGRYSHIEDFLKNYLNVGVYSEAARELNLYEKRRLDEQFYISTGIRNFKGYEDYSQPHKLCFDIETTSLDPLKYTCKKCGKVRHINNLKQVPEECGNNGCTSQKFTFEKAGSTFIIAIRDNRGYRNALVAKGDVDEKGQIKIDPEEEKKLYWDFFEILKERQPSIIFGYNSENFDWNYVLTSARFLGINTKLPITYRNSQEDIYNYYNPLNFNRVYPKEFYKINPRDNGLLEKLDPEDDDYTPVTEERLKRMESLNDKSMNIVAKMARNYCQTTINPKGPIQKSTYKSSLKIGAETESYYKTEGFGVNIVDPYFEVRATKARDSNMPGASLKIAANYKPLKGKTNRTYIPGDKIYRMFKDNKNYICTPDNVYKLIPEKFQDKPEKYLNIVNDLEKVQMLPDFDEKFYGPVKNNVNFDDLSQEKQDILDELESEDKKGYIVSDEDRRKALEEEKEEKNKNFGYIKCSDFYVKNSGNFRLITGSELVIEYALDDVDDTFMVEEHYNKGNFIRNTSYPTSFERFSTMGTAASWNLISVLYCYEKNIALPHMVEQNLMVGGLSRALIIGFDEAIEKADFSSLYPAIQLAHRIFPAFAPYLEDMLLYYYNRRMYYNKRKKLSEIDNIEEQKKKLKECLIEDGEVETANFVDVWSDIEYKNFFSKYRETANNIQLTCKIDINSLFGSLGSGFFLGADMLLAAEITSRGRMYLRSMVDYMLVEHECKPLVLDTDGCNFSIPKEYSEEKKKKYGVNSPYEYEYGGLKGIYAIIQEYNDKRLPTTSKYMKLSSDGRWLSAYQAAKKNYVCLEEDGKVKKTGNSFKSSSMAKYIKDHMDYTLKRFMKDNDLRRLYQDYYMMCEKIYKGNLTLEDVVKKAKVKQLPNDYINRGYTKRALKDADGNFIGFQPKAKQAHMELVLQNNLNVSLGDIIYFVNNGNKRSDSDSSEIDVFEEGDVKFHICKQCGTKHKTKKVLEVSELIANIKNRLKRVKPLNKTDIEKSYALSPDLMNKLLHYQSLLDEAKEFRKLYRESKEDAYKQEVELKKEEAILVSDDIDFFLNRFDKVDDFEFCGKKTGTKLCVSQQFEAEMEKIVVGKKPASYYVPEEVVENEPDKVVEYNRHRALSSFNDGFKVVLKLFKREIRNRILVDVEKDGTLSPMRHFTDQQLEPNKEIGDTLEELLTMEKKEVRFWNKSGKNPFEIPVAEVNIPYPIPKWDKYNAAVDYIQSLKPEVFIARSIDFAREGGIFVLKTDVEDKYELRKRTNERKSEFVCYYNHITKKFIRG